MGKNTVEVRLTAGAEHDLTGIYRRRLIQRGPEGDDGAEALLDRIVKGIEGLADYPERGPVPPELEVLGIRNYRQRSLPPYRVIYLPEGAVITVLIIADGRRDFRTLLEERVLRSR